MQNQHWFTKAFTAIELSCVIAIVAILAWIAPPNPPRQRCMCQKISCANNQRQIGTAYRIWSADNSGRMPQETSMHMGGWSEYLTYSNAGRFCWTNYVVMENELGQSPRLLVCPLDERTPATNFLTISNQNISYFVGAGAREYFPKSILAGDRNLAPGNKPKKDFGYSGSGNEGNDVIFSTNSNVSPVCWSRKMHSDGDRDGAGFILLADGSVQRCNTAQFQTTYQANALGGETFPTGYVNHTNSFRLIFP